MIKFAHLQLHSHYSVSQGLCDFQNIADSAQEKGIFAVALTDIDNMFGWVKFYSKMTAAGVKPIAGADVIFTVCDRAVSASLLCLNNIGYQQLIQMLSEAYMRSDRVGQRVVLDTQHLLKSSGIAVILHPDGLQEALLPQNITTVGEILTCLSPLKEGQRLFASLTKVGLSIEETHPAWAELVFQHNIPMVAVNQVCFMSRKDFQAHEVRLCIDQGRVIQDKSRAVTHTQDQYFKSATEMLQAFSNAKQAFTNTNILAQRCCVTLKMGEVFLPEVAAENMNEYFLREVQTGLNKRLSVAQCERYTLEDYQKRLEREVKTISDMGFPSYFLIVADFIKWSKANGVPVGPGRGSGAGSLAAFALEITDIDPLEYDLLFERFLNPERVSMPDFDIDFCMVGRDKVIDYVAKRYGRLNVSQIITYGRMAAKAVIRDVGRVMGHPYGFVDKLAKLIPFDLGITLDKALAQEPMLAKRYAEEIEVRQLFDLSKVLEGLVRNVGTHAGGVVIAPSNISDYSPVYSDSEQTNVVTQYDKDDIEKIGLVKFDFLGLRTLTIIDWAIKNIKKSQGLDIDITQISLTDAKTFELLQACLTTGVFQLESQGMKELIDRLVPDCFEDIIALVALYRPGPLQSGMVDDFVKRKHGIDKVVYHHPKLEPILNNTYGVILYQEQVMQIAQDMAGYSLGGADLLRRAMGKKKPEEMEKQRTIFSEGAKAEKIDTKVATEIFDLMEKFAGYGFNKSHSAAYALISYQTAWLKANYPTEFMAAVLSSDMDNTDKVIGFLEDVSGLGIQILPPDINHSQPMFSVVEEGKIRYGLSAIKGVGSNAATALVAGRPQEGFHNLLDVCLHTEKVNKKLLESLIKSGACDGLGENRATLLSSVELALQTHQQQSSNQAQGQQDLLGGEIAFSYRMQSRHPKKVELEQERDTLGYYLSGHPVAESRQELNAIGIKPINAISLNQTVRVAGVVNKIKVIKTKKGGRIAFVELSDDSGRVDVAFFDEVYTQCYEMLNQGGVLLIEGATSLDQFTQKTRIQCSKAIPLESYRLKYAPKLTIQVIDPQEALIKAIIACLDQFSGKSSVTFIYQTQKGIATVPLPKKVGVTDEMVASLASLSGIVSCKLRYPEEDIEILKT
ncbi:MAG: DNA polymerase III subunit alpha [Pseudomonadota bacterium]|nr:DNA polymerase III subunit alpha [Pseudomonadota bacterium]